MSKKVVMGGFGVDLLNVWVGYFFRVFKVGLVNGEVYFIYWMDRWN